jgi:Zn-dependent peptidase ImmA (M78 family)
MPETPSISTTKEAPGDGSVLGRLRAMAPKRTLHFREALEVAEWQATALLTMWGISEAPVPDEVVTELPRITTDADHDLAASGMSHWNGTSWVITVNGSEPRTRQRFSRLHELKHIIDHGRPESQSSSQVHSLDGHLEQVADFFAGCVLMPRHLLKQAWASGIQLPTELAELFDVSPAAISVRLTQTGLRRVGRHGIKQADTAPIRWRAHMKKGATA